MTSGVCRSVALFVVLVTGFSPATLAQSDLTSVVGIIHDPTGAVIPSASVTVRNESTGAVRKATTVGNGSFSITNVPAGTYTLTVEAPGFMRYQRSGNEVAANVAATLEATLTVGESSLPKTCSDLTRRGRRAKIPSGGKSR